MPVHTQRARTHTPEALHRTAAHAIRRASQSHDTRHTNRRRTPELQRDDSSDSETESTTPEEDDARGHPRTGQEDRRKDARKYRAWCFTLFQPRTDQALHLEFPNEPVLQKLKDFQCKAILCQLERAPDTGRLHLQGGLWLSEPHSLLWLKREFHNKAHLEPQCAKENFDVVLYCTKLRTRVGNAAGDGQGFLYERGNVPNSQEDRDARSYDKYKKIICLAEQGDLQAVKDEYPQTFLQYYRTLSAIASTSLKQPILDYPQAILFCGPTGTGKSHYARWLAKIIASRYPAKKYNMFEWYNKTFNKFWDNYNGQPVVLIEELTPSMTREMGAFYKQWCDKWEFGAEVKHGAFTEGLRPPWVIMTSNFWPRALWPYEEDYLPMERRLRIIELTGKEKCDLTQANKWLAPKPDFIADAYKWGTLDPNSADGIINPS